ncbi:S-layer homology domain-containing protein [Paenalkalicoccus suaedae]|uniref:S-layer homology domain-containing protein n=2 Tax=Paenalkalicoccus suaedae TaxID=2592382 RepID=A0A859FJ42_9BACI|nr:S-layer homology domain-containing protein [Paenalkalicoccus suaedae]
MVASVAPGAVFANEHAHSFTDIDLEGENLEVIEKLVEAGIINGFPDNTFRPHASITREQAALMMYRALELEGATDVVNTLSQFNDIDPNHRSAVEIAAVIEAGIFKGYNGNLHMGDVISRQEMVSVIVRTFNLELNGETTEFVDEDTIHVSHIEAVKILQSWGVLLGMPHGDGYRFGASDELTRLAFSLMLTRSIETVEEIEAEEPIEDEEDPEDELPGNEEENDDEQVDEEEEEEEVTPAPPGDGWSPGPVGPGPIVTPEDPEEEEEEVSEPTIVSVSLGENATVEVNVGETHEFPETAIAQLSDETSESVSINWRNRSIRFDEPGIEVFEGFVEGFDQPVTQTVSVVQEGIELSEGGTAATVSNAEGFGTALANDALSTIFVSASFDYEGEPARSYTNVEVAEDVNVDFGGSSFTSISIKGNSDISNVHANSVMITGNDVSLTNAEVYYDLEVEGNNANITDSEVGDITVGANVTNITLNAVQDTSTSVHTFSGGGDNSVNLEAGTDLNGEVIIDAEDDIKFTGDGLLTGLVRHTSEATLYMDAQAKEVVIEAPSEVYVTKNINTFMARVSEVKVFIDEEELITNANYREGEDAPTVSSIINVDEEIETMSISSSSTGLSFNSVVDKVAFNHYLRVAGVHLTNNLKNQGNTNGKYPVEVYNVFAEVVNKANELDLETLSQIEVDTETDIVLKGIRDFSNGRVFLDDSFRDIRSHVREQERLLNRSTRGNNPGQFEENAYDYFKKLVEDAREEVDAAEMSAERIEELKNELTQAREEFLKAYNPLWWEPKEDEWTEGRVTLKLLDEEEVRYYGTTFVYLDEEGEFLEYGFWENASFDGHEISHNRLAYLDDVHTIYYFTNTSSTIYDGTFTVEEFKNGVDIELTREGNDYSQVTFDVTEDFTEYYVSLGKSYTRSGGTPFNFSVGVTSDQPLYIPHGSYFSNIEGRIEDKWFLSHNRNQLINDEFTQFIVNPENLKDVDIRFDKSTIADGLSWSLNYAFLDYTRYGIDYFYTSFINFHNNFEDSQALLIDEDAIIRTVSLQAKHPSRNETYYVNMTPAINDGLKAILMDTAFELNYSDLYEEGMDIIPGTNLAEILNLRVVDSFNNHLDDISFDLENERYYADVEITISSENESNTFKRSLGYMGYLWTGFLQHGYTGEVTLDINFPDIDVVLPPDQTFTFNMVSYEDYHNNEGTEATPIENDEVIYEEVEGEVSATIDYNN